MATTTDKLLEGFGETIGFRSSTIFTSLNGYEGVAVRHDRVLGPFHRRTSPLQHECRAGKIAIDEFPTVRHCRLLESSVQWQTKRP